MLHIGWQKSASTLLQREIARQYPVSSRFNQVIFKMHNSILDRVSMEASPNLSDLCDEIESVKAEVGNEQVFITDERISQWRGTHASRVLSGETARRYQEAWADIAVRVFPERHVLIVYREPLSWLRSQYAQDIKCGAAYCYLPFSSWCEANRDFLIAASDVVALYEIYCARYGKERVTLLRYEAFREAREIVRSLLETRFGLTVSEDFFDAKSNASLSTSQNEVLRQFQAMIEVLSRDLDIPPERARNLRDHLFWFINHGAVNNPDFRGYMDSQYLGRVLSEMQGMSIPAMIDTDRIVSDSYQTAPENLLGIMRDNQARAHALLDAKGFHS